MPTVCQKEFIRQLRINIQPFVCRVSFPASISVGKVFIHETPYTLFFFDLVGSPVCCEVFVFSSRFVWKVLKKQPECSRLFMCRLFGLLLFFAIVLLQTAHGLSKDWGVSVKEAEGLVEVRFRVILQEPVLVTATK